jgi:protein-tyrosine phosphatase
MATRSHAIAVLFVCMGNICRSPTGEGVFRRHVEDAGLGDRIHIDSAGTIASHAGEPADPRMRDAAARRDYTLDSIARAVVPDDYARFDLIIAMDHDNYRDLLRRAPDRTEHIELLGRFLPGVVAHDTAPPVPDPYYGGAAGFDHVIDLIEQACPALLHRCRELLARGSP